MSKPPLGQPKRRSRSGPNLTEARRRELDYGTIKVRLRSETLAILDDEAKSSGFSRTKVIESAIRLYANR